MQDLYYKIGEHMLIESGMATITDWNGHFATLLVEDFEGKTEERRLTRQEIAAEMHALTGKNFRVFIEKGGVEDV